METKVECSKGTLDFLLFSYFGITLEDANESGNLIDVAIKKAYADATMQAAYNAMFSKNDYKSKIETASREAYIACAEQIKNELKKLPGLQSQEEYDEWHSEICEFMVGEYAEKIHSAKEAFFSYGNAQKWVNMTMKYLYLMCGVFDENSAFMQEIGNTVMTLSEYLHVPVDSYIIEAVWDKPVTLPLRPKGRKREGYKYASEKVEPWSKWNKVQYDEFRKSLNFEGRCPLEWENEAWLKVAKERRGK